MTELKRKPFQVTAGLRQSTQISIGFLKSSVVSARVRTPQPVSASPRKPPQTGANRRQTPQLSANLSAVSPGSSRLFRAVNADSGQQLARKIPTSEVSQRVSITSS